MTQPYNRIICNPAGFNGAASLFYPSFVCFNRVYQIAHPIINWSSNSSFHQSSCS